MKSGIHPSVHQDAVATCSNCSAQFHIPALLKEVSVENCRMCHPVYTGKKQVEAKGGRIERFKKRLEAAK